ncbi:tetratricopeptide repeat protein [Bacteroidota bacterium]
MPEDRRLAAIMFTDIVGYTALMGSDEERAYQLLKRNRQVQRPLIEKHGGKWLKEIGDGVLASFPTVSEAVYCAKEIQEVCEEEPDLKIRIGIHLGEVIFEDEDVFGDGVNIASRLEPLAPVGGIYISESVYRNIQNKKGINAEFVKEETLKNVKHPVRIYEVEVEKGVKQTVLHEEKKHSKRSYYIIGGILVLIVAVILIWFLYPRPQPIVEDVEIDKSIAVRTFWNESAEEGNEYFVNGMVEDIRNNLAKISDLRVISRGSMEKYRETDLSTKEIANELDVNYILEGTVQKLGNQLKIHAQLILANDDDHIWEDTYERDISDAKEIFKVQSEIAQEVASEVKVVIAPVEKELIEKTPTTNLALYDIYLKAREKYNESSIDEAVLLYQTALEIDSTFALAYTGLAWAYWTKHYWDEYFEEDFLDSALVLANVALSYDDQLEEAYNVRGKYYQQNGEIEKAINDFEKALSINPNYADALRSLGGVYHYNNMVKAISSLHKAASIERSTDLPDIYISLGRYYRNVGLLEKSRYYYQKKFDLDNDSISYLNNLARLEFSKGNYEMAIELFEKAERIDSTRVSTLWLAGSHVMLDHIEESYKYMSRFSESSRGITTPIYFYGYVSWQLDRKEEANNYFNEQIRNSQESIRLTRPYSLKNAYYHLAVTYFFLGEKEKGYQYLERFSNESLIRFRTIARIKYNPMLKNVREEPRFKAIMKKIEEKNQKERDRVLAWMEEEGIALK